IHYALTLGVKIKGDERKAVRASKNPHVEICNAPLGGIKEYLSSVGLCGKSGSTVIVGSGPAGLMCALTLAKAGVKPTVIERGGEVRERVKKVSDFFAGADLDAECNVQFGEGGAGTFSDGKLNSGVGGVVAPLVLREFAAHGGGEELIYQGKPHIGTDILPQVVSGIRDEIISLGGTFIYNTKVVGIRAIGGRLKSVILEGERQGILDCDTAVFAIGHSARDTYEMLLSNSVVMSPKPFAIGLRIEHRQQDINIAQYGSARSDLPAADYKLTADIDGRGCYTFCMCPGGEVVAAASEYGGCVVNGMSNSKRDAVNANSAVLASVTPQDFGDKVMDGVEFQRRYERAAFKLSGGYAPVVQRLEDFRAKRVGGIGDVLPSCRRGYVLSDINECLPEYAARSIDKAIDVFARKIPIFNHADSMLSGVETRTSAPLRILRGDDGHSSIRGLLPCGEGAGYAGGITSAAVDGIRTAIKILESI
ncbi:MAG: NAD-binding protein, partial [Clostridia bacterium]|nr:NAD-binding protein [Clostridia bacterium]